MSNELPVLCYTEHNGKLVIIENGVEGYYPYTGSKEISELGANALNELIGVTEEQAVAMKGCSMFGWGVTPAYSRNLEVSAEQSKKQELTRKLVSAYDEVISHSSNIKDMEHKLQEVIEEVYCGNEWWVTTKHFPLFNELMCGWSRNVLVLMIVASIK